MIDAEVQRILGDTEQRVERLIGEHEAELDALAGVRLEKETAGPER